MGASLPLSVLRSGLGLDYGSPEPARPAGAAGASRLMLSGADPPVYVLSRLEEIRRRRDQESVGLAPCERPRTGDVRREKVDPIGAVGLELAMLAAGDGPRSNGAPALRHPDPHYTQRFPKSPQESRTSSRRTDGP